MSDTHPPNADDEPAAAAQRPDGGRPVGDEGHDEPYAIAPVDSSVAQTIDQLRLRPSSVPSSAPPARPLDHSASKQFTLPMLFALTLVTSLVFALMRTLPAALFAAALGLFLALAALAGMTRTQFGTMVWWTLLGVYSTAVVVLLVTQ